MRPNESFECEKENIRWKIKSLDTDVGKHGSGKDSASALHRQ
jgi:hypothetical protein